MSTSLDRLYNLLPPVYRLRDSDENYPLRALLQVIGEQTGVVEDDITQLYENWFIETCQDWVVPYLGSLVGYRQVHAAGEPSSLASAEAQLRNKILIPRREIANTIRFRRRKGTLAVTHELAEAVAGWPARSVEFYRLLAFTQSINLLRLGRGCSADIRDGDAMDLLSGAFSESAHTVDIRNMTSKYSPGRYSIPNVGVFVWRLKPYSVTHTPAYCYEKAGDQCYQFSALGNDTQLFTRPETAESGTREAGMLNVPAPIMRRAFAAKGADIEPGEETGVNGYYGAGKSFSIYAPDWPKPGDNQKDPLPADVIIPANLSGWKHKAPHGHILVDPKLGRFVFPVRELPKSGVWVDYEYGFSTDMGGGEYSRPLAEPLHFKAGDFKIYQVGPGLLYTRIVDAIAQWEWDRPDKAIIEIEDSGVYTEQIRVTLKENQYLQIRAANRKRPVVRLLDMLSSLPDSVQVTGEAGSWLVLDGLLITGRGVRVEGAVAGLAIRHCTLVPGWGLDCDCEPHNPSEPSLELVNAPICVTIEHSIIGSILVNWDERAEDPLKLHILDSIVDATSPEIAALSGAEGCIASAIVKIVRCTVIGETHVHLIELAENTIFEGLVLAARRQKGCVRFCYLPPGSRTPRRYECQPDLAEGAARASTIAANPSATNEQISAAEQAAAERTRPQFNSLRYGTPDYCQLADFCPCTIARGADDESEMGAFHDLFQPQREANLRTRLEEFTPAAMDAGIIHAT
jgi:hypothetical protein